MEHFYSKFSDTLWASIHRAWFQMSGITLLTVSEEPKWATQYFAHCFPFSSSAEFEHFRGTMCRTVSSLRFKTMCHILCFEQGALHLKQCKELKIHGSIDTRYLSSLWFKKRYLIWQKLGGFLSIYERIINICIWILK